MDIKMLFDQRKKMVDVKNLLLNWFNIQKIMKASKNQPKIKFLLETNALDLEMSR